MPGLRSAIDYFEMITHRQLNSRAGCKAPSTSPSRSAEAAKQTPIDCAGAPVSVSRQIRVM